MGLYIDIEGKMITNFIGLAYLGGGMCLWAEEVAGKCVVRLQADIVALMRVEGIVCDIKLKNKSWRHNVVYICGVGN